MNPRRLIQRIQRIRHLSQAFFFILFTLLVVGSVCSFIIGNTGVIEPLGALQILVASGLSIPQAKIIAFTFAAGIFIAAIMLLGRAWCSWACPIGVLNELTDHILTKRRFKSIVEMRAKKVGDKGRLWLKETKYFTLGVVLLSAAVTRSPVWCSFCPIGTICRGSVAGGFVAGLEMALVGAVVAANTYEKRFFCKYICPVAGLLTLISRLNPFIKPSVRRDRCKVCAECKYICPEGLMVCEEKSFAECTKCLVCISKCPYGAISISLIGRGSAQPVWPKLVKYLAKPMGSLRFRPMCLQDQRPLNPSDQGSTEPV